LISEAVAPNQLYFAVACTMNEKACITAMKWFRECLFFSRDYTDIPHQLLEYSEDTDMLAAIANYAKMADLGIQDMQFEIKNEELADSQNMPDNIPEGIRAALQQFLKALSDAKTDGRLSDEDITILSPYITYRFEHEFANCTNLDLIDANNESTNTE